MKKKAIWIIAAIILLIYFISTMFFCLDERNIAIILRFGKPVRTIIKSGIKFKLPIPIEIKILFDKRIMIYDPTATEYLTQDKQNIVADIYICWRIVDPLLFLQALRTTEIAESRLEDIIRSTAGATIGTHNLSAFVSDEEEGTQLDTIMALMTSKCNKQIRAQYGIEIIDVKIKRFNFTEDNLPSVYARMWAERERIARKYRAEGHKSAAGIKAEAEKRATIILSEAYRESEILKGQGDAQSMKIYAQAYRKDPDFYKFIRTLESYKKFIDSKTTIIFRSDSPLLELLEQGPSVESNK